jgi:hypothetical protein
MLALFICCLSVAGRISASDTTLIILSELPNEPQRYAALRAAADPLFVQALPLTHSEVWSVSSEHLSALATAAATLRVTMLPITGIDIAATLPTSHDDMTAGQKSMMASAQRSRAAVNSCVVTLPDPRIMEYVLTRHDQSGHYDENETLTIALRKDLWVKARFRNLRSLERGYAWHGVIEETGEPVTLMWRLPGELTGQVYFHGHQYVVRHLGGSKYGIVEIAPEIMPPEHPSMVQMPTGKIPKSDADAIKGELARPLNSRSTAPEEPRRNLQDQRAGASPTELAFNIPPPLPSVAGTPQIVIDVMVPYTAKAASHYVDIKSELIDLAIEEANQSFVNSGVTNVQLRLVHAYQTDYVESGTHFDHVFRLVYKHDGYMDEVHALRDAYHADVVVLIVDDPNGCGLAAGVAPGADHAFASVHYECAATSYSLAHEIGHILGARHDVALDNTPVPFSYGHGFTFANKWRTMMSYAEDCGGCPRLPIWSSSMILVGGIRAGDALSDNARVISETALRVSRFR